MKAELNSRIKKAQFERHIKIIETYENELFFVPWIRNIFSIVEPQLLKLGNWALKNFKNEHIWFKGPAQVVPWIIGKLIFTSFFHSQVLTLQEVKNLLLNLEEGYSGFIATIGVCPCRKGMNIYSEEIPSRTDIQILTHGPIYMKHHPDFKRASASELVKKIDEFDKLGLVHMVFGLCDREGSEVAICNCDKDVCFPLRSEIQKTYRIIPGFSVVIVDKNKCTDQCSVKEKCVNICSVNARHISSKNNKIFVDTKTCIGCGVCMNLCPEKANKLVDRKKKYVRFIPRFMVERN